MHYPSSFFLSEAFFSRELCAQVDLFLELKQTVLVLTLVWGNNSNQGLLLNYSNYLCFS